MPVEFFQTQMGHKFFDSTMPRLVAALERLAETPARSQTDRPAECIRDAMGRVMAVTGKLLKLYAVCDVQINDSSFTPESEAAINKDLELLKGALEEWERG